MVRKTLMITLYLLIGYQAQATTAVRGLASEVARSQAICTLQAGDVGKLKYKSSSYQDAFSKVTNECFQRRTDLFVKRENHYPDQDRQILFAQSCANEVKCN